MPPIIGEVGLQKVVMFLVSQLGSNTLTPIFVVHFCESALQIGSILGNVFKYGPEGPPGFPENGHFLSYSNTEMERFGGPGIFSN